MGEGFLDVGGLLQGGRQGKRSGLRGSGGWDGRRKRETHLRDGRLREVGALGGGSCPGREVVSEGTADLGSRLAEVRRVVCRRWKAE